MRKYQRYAVEMILAIAIVYSIHRVYNLYEKSKLSDRPFDPSVWGNVADWMQAIAAITMIFLAFIALNSWKEEKKLEYEAEAITKSFEALKLCKRILDINFYREEFIPFPEQDSLLANFPDAVNAIFLSVSYDRMVQKFDKDFENLRILSLKMKTLYKDKQNTVFYEFYYEINEVIKNEYSRTKRFLKMDTNLQCCRLPSHYRIWVDSGFTPTNIDEIENFMDNYPNQERIEKLERLFCDVFYNEGVEDISKKKRN